MATNFKFTIKHRITLTILALAIQIPVLAITWTISFRNVRGELASVVQEYIIQENVKTVREISQRLPMNGEVPDFKSSEWEEYQKVIETAGADLAAGGFACLLDPSGNILCHPEIRMDESLRSVNLENKHLKNTETHPRLDGLDDIDLKPILSGELDFLVDGTHYVATTTIAGTDLRLLVHQPESSLLMTSAAISKSVIGSGLLAIGMITVISGSALVLLIRSYDSVFQSITRRLKGDLQIAKEIQQATIPTEVPQISGYQISGWNQPAEETGGDTFDAIGISLVNNHVTLCTQNPNRVVVMVADATGHGIGPALAASEVRSLLRMGIRMQSSLENVVKHINEQLAMDLPDGRFITAWLGVINSDSGQIESFSAGQAPLLIYRAVTNTVEMLIADDVPFGVIPDFIDLKTRKIDLDTGDSLVVCTDGIFEAMGKNGLRFGHEHFNEIFFKNHESADNLADSVRTAINTFTGSVFDDDQTVIVIRKT